MAFPVENNDFKGILNKELVDVNKNQGLSININVDEQQQPVQIKHIETNLNNTNKTEDDLTSQCNQKSFNPIEFINRVGKRELYQLVAGLDVSNVFWDETQEVIEIEETVYWLESFDDEINNCRYTEPINLQEWLKVGQKKLTIADETSYCDPLLLQTVLNAKEVFDKLDPVELCKARSRANPFETLKSAFFMNRAALKMANIDAVTGFMFTSVDRQVEHKQFKTPYYFADICAGPGGFSEYVLWRKKWAFKGFGLTLKGDHDFKLYESTCSAPETFEALYGILDNGDIYYPDNIKEFCNNVKSQTNGLGVHFVMADGGFSVEGQENIQEVLSKRLYICQCYTALNVLRANGHFVVKMFDLYTPFSVGLIYLMHLCFHKITILKPNASRPANSERYFVCSKLKNNCQTDIIRDYMRIIVQTLWDLQNKEKNFLDIHEIVPSYILQDNKRFKQYITDCNNRLAKKQIIGLMKLTTFCRNPTLMESRQEQLRVQCLQFWQIPDKIKIPHLPQLSIDDLVPSYLLNTNLLYGKDFNSFEELQGEISNPKDWSCIFLSSGIKSNLCNIYVGIGNNRVYRYQHNRWVRVKCVKLIKGTVLFGELVKEYTSMENQSFKRSLHVIDALRLGDTSLADLPYNERLDLIKIYCQAVNCEFQTNYANIRTKNIHSLVKLQLTSLPIKNERNELLNFICNDENEVKKCHITNSMLLLRTDCDQNFYSSLSSRLIVYLNHEGDKSNENISSILWHSIINFLQKSILKNI